MRYEAGGGPDAGLHHALQGGEYLSPVAGRWQRPGLAGGDVAPHGYPSHLLVHHLKGGGPPGGLCLTVEGLRLRHHRKCNVGCASGRRLGCETVQPGQGLLQLALLSGPAVGQLSSPTVWVQAGPAVRRLSGPAVWAPTGSAVWEMARCLDMVSATTFSFPGMCWMSLDTVMDCHSTKKKLLAKTCQNMHFSNFTYVRQTCFAYNFFFGAFF